MSTSLRTLFPLVLVPLAAAAHAQTGTLDQHSPFLPIGSATVFDGNTPGTTWQLQVRAGLSGMLEGFTIEMNATQGPATLLAALRLGPGWNTSPVVFQSLITTCLLYTSPSPRDS